jgi:hypothetical protein
MGLAHEAWVAVRQRAFAQALAARHGEPTARIDPHGRPAEEPD